jgi:iron complex transport system substrate-binding protein
MLRHRATTKCLAVAIHRGLRHREATKCLAVAIQFLVLFIFSQITYAACNVVDDAGRKVTLSHPAKRIISLAPDITELLFTVGAGKQIVGVTRGSDYPADAKKIPIVASYNSIDNEAILALHPDLIVVWSGGRLTTFLEKFSIPIYINHPQHLLDIPRMLRNLGCLTGHKKQAERAAVQFTQRYQHLAAQYSHKKNLSVFYQIGSRPLLTITRQSWINDVLLLCGGQNIFAGLPGTAQAVAKEAVIMANPQVILGTDLKFWETWPQLSAVRHHALFTINPDTLERANPRILGGAEKVCELIQLARNSYED